jgi:hypothetical protein
MVDQRRDRPPLAWRAGLELLAVHVVEQISELFERAPEHSHAGVAVSLAHVPTLARRLSPLRVRERVFNG